MKTLTIRLFAALTAMTLLASTPAYACFASPEQAARFEAETAVLAQFERREHVRIDDLTFDEDHIDALVSWELGDERVEQQISLARRDDRWDVVYRTYAVRAGTFRRFAEAHRR